MITSSNAVRNRRLRPRCVAPLLLALAAGGCAGGEAGLKPEDPPVAHAEATPVEAAPAMKDDAGKDEAHGARDTTAERDAAAGADGKQVDDDARGPGDPPWADGECDAVYELRASSGVNRGKPYVVQPQVPVSPQFLFDAPWGDAPVKAIAFHPLIDNAEVLKTWYLYDAGDGTQLAGWQRGRAFSPNPRDDRDELPRGPRSLRLDLRYQNPASEPATDRSGVAICVVRIVRPSDAPPATDPAATSAAGQAHAPN